MNSFPFLSESYLTDQYANLIKALSNDRNNLLPLWARTTADHLFRNKRFIVCGSTCRSEISILAAHAEVLAIVDDTLCHSGETIFGISIIDTDRWIDYARSDPTIVTCILVPHSRAFQYFLRQCIEWKIHFLGPLQLLYLFRLQSIDTKTKPGRFLWFGYEFFLHTLEKSDKLLAYSRKLTDEFSRITWLCMLMYYLTLNPFFMEACAVGMHEGRFGLNSYTIPRRFYKFSDHEVYVNAGACRGETLEGFIQAVNGRFKHIYAYEPFAPHHRQIRNLIDSLQPHYPLPLAERMTLIEKGVWEKDDVLRFKSYQEWEFIDFNDNPLHTPAAFITDSGFADHIYDAPSETEQTTAIPVTTIDGSTDQDATFLKIEVEGSELQALKGATKTIECNHPKISLAMYHKPDDYTVLMDYILNTGINYRLGFLHHNHVVPCSTVLYCYTDNIED